MISFIKANSSIIVPIILIFLTVDMFLLIYKFKNYCESIVNLRISYDISKSYCANFYSYTEYKLVILYLTIENTSTSPTDITRLELTDMSNSYLANVSEIRDYYNENQINLVTEDEDEDFECVNIDILSENILRNTEVSPHGVLKGYVVFENVESLTDTSYYKIIVETSNNKFFEKELNLSPLSRQLYFVNQFDK